MVDGKVQVRQLKRSDGGQHQQGLVGKYQYLVVSTVVTGVSDVLQQHLLVDVLWVEQSNGIIQIFLENFPVQQTVLLGGHHEVVSVVLETSEMSV